MAELPGARGPAIRAATVNRWSSGVRPWFIGRAVLSLLGFALPSFRVSRSYGWYYGGWSMLTTKLLRELLPEEAAPREITESAPTGAVPGD